MNYKKAKFRFNGGVGAILCESCDKIVATGNKHEDKEYFCSSCSSSSIPTPTLHKFKKNQAGNDYVVGDIHGMYILLIESLNEIGFNFTSDRLFTVGDLIDRGPDSVKCLELCYEPWFYSVRGNHEQMAFDAVIRNSDPRY